MPWVAPIVGFVDHLGYLRCVECADESQQRHRVMGDQHFGTDDKCDRCGKQLNYTPTSKYVEA